MARSKKKAVHIGDHKVSCLISTRFDKESTPVQHMLVLDFSGAHEDWKEVQAARQLTVDYQASLRRSFDSKELFEKHLKGEGKKETISAQSAGSKVVSKAQQASDLKRFVNDMRAKGFDNPEIRKVLGL